MSILSTDRYSDLIRHGRIDGHDAGPDDYDAVLAELAHVHAVAVRHGRTAVAAVAKGLMTAVLVIDPRQTHAADRAYDYGVIPY